MCLSSRTARLGLRAAILLTACLACDVGRAAIRDGGIDPANLGKGEWIYILPDAINKLGGPVTGVTDLNSLMIFLKNQGLRYLIIKAATGPNLYPSTANPQLTSDVVNAAHAAGLWVFGYNRSDGTDIPGEIDTANYVFGTGADGFVFDAESEWESQNLADNANKAIQLCSAVRANWPNKFLAHSPYPIISYHSTFPYKEFGYYCDAVMPQDYWIEIGVTPTYMVSWMTTEWNNWQNGLSGQWRNSIKPIVADGQGWSSTNGTVTAAQVTEFFTALKNQPNPATTGGYKGANFFRAELHPLALWDAIRTNNIGVFTNAPVVTNVSVGAVTANSATVSWTTDQSADSVVDYGLDTSYGTSVTNSTPIYYHTVALSGLNAYTTYYFRVRSKNASNQTGMSSVDVFATAAVTATNVIVESRSGGLNYAAYSDTGTASPNSWFDSTGKSTAAGCTAGIGSRYNSNAGIGGPATWFQVHPTLPVAGGRYSVYVTIPSAASAGASVSSTITMTGCTGLPGTTGAFSSGAGLNTWNPVGMITNNPGVAAVTIRFDETANDLRFIADAVKFVFVPTTNPPVIVTPPPASQTNLQGSAASFSVVASGSPPLHYRWRFNGSDITNAILSTYTKDLVQPADAGSYTVIITNGAGAVTSSASLLTVVLPPKITAQPTDATAMMGSNAQFSVSATGTAPLTYQWQLDGTNIDGATASSLVVTNAHAADGGAYAVLVTNAYGAVFSSIATLTVLDPYIVTHPQNQSVAAGATANFAVSAGGTAPLLFQWRKDGADLADGGSIGGAQTANLTVSDVQAENMGNYSVVVSNVNGWVVSSNAALTAPLPPYIWSQPANQTATAGSAVTFTVGASGPGLIYRWKRAGTNLSDGGKFSGTASANLVVTNVQGSEMAAYSVVVSNSYGNASSSNALLSLSPLAAWGYNFYGQSDVPAGLTDVQAVAGGYYHSLVLRADGTVAAWGSNAANYTNVVNGLTNVAAIAGGVFHSLALMADGTVAAWGTDDAGQTNVPAGLSHVVAIAGGYAHSLALKDDGTVATWGGTNAGSNYGQTNTPAGLTNVLGIAAGWYHNLALRREGSVVAWGAGTTNSGSSPHWGQAAVPDALSNVVAVAAGAFHSLALRADGTVVAWGAGATNTGSSPHWGQSRVPDGLSNVVAVAAGAFHSVALKSDGTLVSWGAGTTNSGANPQYGQSMAPASLANVRFVAGGGYHSLTLQADGSPYFTTQPQDQNVMEGATVSLAALAVGAQPMSCQWQHDGTDLPGGTNALLTLPSVQVADAGSYSLLATNAQGSAISRTAILAVTAITRPHIDSIISLPDGRVQLEVSGGPGNFAVECAPTLSGWTQLSSLMATGVVFQYVDLESNQVSRFYRIRVQP